MSLTFCNSLWSEKFEDNHIVCFEQFSRVAGIVRVAQRPYGTHGAERSAQSHRKRCFAFVICDEMRACQNVGKKSAE